MLKLNISTRFLFTAAGRDCHRSLDYMAERTQASRTSVCRALNLPVTRGYVTKVKSAPNRPNSYTANLDSHSQNVTVTEEAQCQNVTVTDEAQYQNVTVTDEAQYQNVTVTDEAQYQNVTATVPKCYSESIKMLPNNKDNNKKNNKDNYLPTNCYALEEELRPIPIGERVVRMTIHEYANLLRAVGVLPTLNYIRKLERQILTYPERNYPNHYKTIVTWAREDFRIGARGEEILKS